MVKALIRKRPLFLGGVMGVGRGHFGATLVLMLALFFATSFSPSARASNLATTPPVITLFTHGETLLMKHNTSGKITGPALDLFRCAAKETGRDFKIALAPLSRAKEILTDLKYAVWFPSAFRGNAERLARSVGSAGDLEIFWYQLESDYRDPASLAFKNQARVTTFKGSALAASLRRDGYNFIEGSADSKRLVAMLLTGKVDGLLAVDFKGRLSAETSQKLSNAAKMTKHSNVPTAFQFSQAFAREDPAFITQFRTAFHACLATAKAAG
jgi:hypothetical protein